MVASVSGHAEAIEALLTAPGIDVNHVDVSLYLLMQGLGVRDINLCSSLTLTLTMMTCHPVMRNMYPNPMERNQVCVLFFCFGDSIFVFHQHDNLVLRIIHLLTLCR